MTEKEYILTIPLDRKNQSGQQILRKLQMRIADGVYSVVPIPDMDTVKIDAEELGECPLYTDQCVLTSYDGLHCKVLRRGKTTKEQYYDTVLSLLETGEWNVRYFLENGTIPLEIGDINSDISRRAQAIVGRYYGI